MPTSTVNRSVVNTPEIKPITTEREPIKKEIQTIIINYDENKKYNRNCKASKIPSRYMCYDVNQIL